MFVLLECNWRGSVAGYLGAFDKLVDAKASPAAQAEEGVPGKYSIIIVDVENPRYTYKPVVAVECNGKKLCTN